MSDSARVVILGGHGKIALLAAPKLKAAGFAVDSVIRNPDQSSDVKTAGANPVVLDIETADTQALADLFAGAQAVVFSAGAGGGSPERTRAVDLEAAKRSIDAAEQAGVKRFVMVSYASASVDSERVDPESSFYPYVQAKSGADEHLRASSLDFTILGPGGLTLEPSSGKVLIADAAGDLDGQTPADDVRVTSRDLVADVITHVIAESAAVRETVNFYDGQTPIAEAIR
ncbi:SDR family oxidoreductase [Brevibacterium linens]|uniref:Nucleoside-diphosphate-sugar epimerase n=2 Tax=Brevibacterium linens TaxID=1703 RepID=A0A2H1K6A0_BRELN|nr:SDR family oxidoreductase [Brevibacterium linens]KAB1949036.1 SDR family oxidoreductase [Brevibacterium linens ATCC 9172]SMX69068.1 Nucleoside-diphosphate-sugar epimerase [Brevibacterium linens ATCC 9172]SMX94782.1 Nucleoside-diphosphate-sugar epimerase [Brevibacterium linens]